MLLAAMPAALLTQTNGDSDDPWHFDPPDAYQLTQAAQSRQTDYYSIGDLALYFWTDLWHDAFCYPYDNDVNDPGTYFIDPHNPATGDFNGDGHQDMVMVWAIFSHVVPTKPLYSPSILLNDGHGNLVESTDSIFAHGDPPRRYFIYRTKVADFNGDGVDDIVIGAMGLVGRACLGQPAVVTSEPIVLILSDGNGGMVDASHQIEGQENGNSPEGYEWAHDISVGDIDGDGDQDFCAGKFLFLNDGRGNFRNGSWMLPRTARAVTSYMNVMSSAMGDLDGDGVDDLVVMPFEGNANGVGHIFLSSGASPLSEYRHIELPEGRYGPTNTKRNYTAIADFDQDGRNDILIAQTRANPYYQGRYLQLLINMGNGVFLDESTRISGNEDRALEVTGEGPVFIVDVNDDGFPDIVDRGAVFLNDGTGRYQPLPEQELPHLDYTNLVRFRELPQENESEPPRLAPIQLDGQGPLEFVSWFHVSQGHAYGWPSEPGDISDGFLYTINPVEPFQPSPLQPLPRIDLSATGLSFAAPVGINPAAQQITLANSGLGDLEWLAIAASDGDWLEVSPIDGEGQSNLTVTAVSEQLPAGVYEGSVSVQVAGAVNSPQIISVRLAVGSPVFTSESFVNAASYATGRFAAEMWVSLFGQSLAERLIFAEGSLPTTLGGVSISITDSQSVQRPAKLQFVHPGQINFLLPAGLALGPAVVEVTNSHGETASATIQIEAVAPGLFSADASGRGPAAATYLRVGRDGTRTEGSTFDVTAPGDRSIAMLDRGLDDEVYLSFFGTGFRNHSSVSARLRNEEGYEVAGTRGMEVLAAVPQGQFEGLDQAVIGPLNWFFTANSKEIDIVFTFDGVESNTVTIQTGNCFGQGNGVWYVPLPDGCPPRQ